MTKDGKSVARAWDMLRWLVAMGADRHTAIRVVRYVMTHEDACATICPSRGLYKGVYPYEGYTLSDDDERLTPRQQTMLRGLSRDDLREAMGYETDSAVIDDVYLTEGCHQG